VTPRASRDTSSLDRLSLRFRPGLSVPALVPRRRSAALAGDLRVLDVIVTRMVVNGETRRLAVDVNLGTGEQVLMSELFAEPRNSVTRRSLTDLPVEVLAVLADEPIWSSAPVGVVPAGSTKRR